MSRSAEIYKKLCKVIPGGVNSPARAFMGLGVPPVVARSGFADLLTDEDGKTYIDYCASWGALIHGHAHPEINKAAIDQIHLGSTFGITTEVEGKLAEKIILANPSCDKVRFVSTGTEATMSATRLARGFTKKNLIIKFAGNYHGHADPFLVQAGSSLTTLSKTSSSLGVPSDIVRHTISLPYNDSGALAEFFKNFGDDIAAVILEPIAGNMGVVKSSKEFLQASRDLTKKYGSLLIFDEVISGFRVGFGGAQALYGIVPDLSCFGKIIGGGFPAAAFGGRGDIMDHLAPLGGVYQAGTLSGNPVAMRAGLKAIELLEKKGTYEELVRKTALITKPIKELIEKKKLNACIQEEGSMLTLFFGKKEVRNREDTLQLDLKRFAEFFKYMLDNGVYIPPSQHEAWFVSTVHTDEHLVKTSRLIEKFLS